MPKKINGRVDMHVPQVVKVLSRRRPPEGKQREGLALPGAAREGRRERRRRRDGGPRAGVPVLTRGAAAARDAAAGASHAVAAARDCHCGEIDESVCRPSDFPSEHLLSPASSTSAATASSSRFRSSASRPVPLTAAVPQSPVPPSGTRTAAPSCGTAPTRGGRRTSMT